MKIISIETSCDDTCITIFEAKGGIQNAEFKILANNSISQINIHIPYGGVFPMLAKREHERNLPVILEKCLKQAKLDKKEKPVDLIVVTEGPGLEPSLWTGIVFAKDLSKKWGVPIMPANHMEGHVFSVFGKPKGKFKIDKLSTPIISLLVSGGHTELIVINKWMDYKIIGETLDDAVGEAFDKVARMIGLPYPGGPEISKLAEIGRNNKPNFEVSFPRPMLHTKDFNFSYSGLKTSVLYFIEKIKPLTEEKKVAIALEFENAAIECLVHKTKKAIEKYGAKTLVMGGGVSANTYLRKEMKRITGKKVKLLIPEKTLSMDNSVMIGIVGYLNYVKKGKKAPRPSSIKAKGNLRLSR